jgi:hypothetical protein
MVLPRDRISSRDSLTRSVTVIQHWASSGHVTAHSSILPCFSKNFDGVFDEILATKEVLLPEFQRFGPPDLLAVIGDIIVRKGVRVDA